MPEKTLKADITVESFVVTEITGQLKLSINGHPFSETEVKLEGEKRII